MVRITFYGGVGENGKGEVGGNKILVESKRTKLMLDFGRRMNFDSNFFAEFLDTRTATTLKDRITIGALPRIDGIYRRDLLIPIGLDGNDVKAYKRILSKDSPLLRLDEDFKCYEDVVENGRVGIDAILLSHAHLDHTGDIMFLHTNIPLYCSNETKILIDAIDEITAFKSEAIRSKENAVAVASKGYTPGALQPSRDKADLQRTVHIMADGESREIGDSQVTLIGVDHSVPGAASFIVEMDGKRILYTGDIRFHGTHPMTIEDFAQKIGSGIDVMICEGTRINSKKLKKEDDVEKQIAEKVEQTKGLVFIDFSWKDTTRYETVKKVAVKSGRTFVINAKLAYILDRLDMYPEESEPVRVFLKRKGTALYSPADYSKQKHEYGLSTDWETGIDDSHYRNGLTAQDIMNDPGKYILMLSFFDMGQIFDFTDKEGKIKDSWFIRAQCEPFSDEMEIDEERMINWLEKFGIGYDPGGKNLPDGCTNQGCSKLRDRIDRSHVSGHASYPELVELILKVRPKMLIPIHTLHPELFQSVVGDIEKETGFKINLMLPALGAGFDI